MRMTRVVAHFLLFLLISCSTVWTEAKLKLTASPSQLTVGVSPNLTVQCTAPPLKDSNSSAVVLLSLAISEKTRKFKQGKVLASVTTSESGNLKYSPDLRGEAEGQLNEIMGGHLTISISKPTELDAKLYECQLIYFNAFWEVKTNKARFRVSTSSATRHHVLGQFKRWKQEMTTRLSQLELNSSLKFEEMENKLTEISSGQVDLSSRLETLAVRLETSMEHQRRFYNHATQMRRVIQSSSNRQDQLERMFSNETKLLQLQVESLKKQLEAVKVKHRCSVLGGYLVELSSIEEYEYVQEFLTSTRPRNIWVGYTRRDPREMHWVQMTHPKEEGFLPWDQGEPLEGGTCAYMREEPWRIAATNCDAVARFLCEVPLP